MNTSPDCWRWTSHAEADTDRLGTVLAEMLQPGMVVALVGPLGSGKTRLVRAVATALGADANTVNSPTFVLIQEYAARIPVYHFDTYRLRDIDEFLELGAEEIFAAEGICFVEWADRVAEVLPDELLRVEIEHCGENSRCFTFSWVGERAQRAVRRLQASFE